MREDEKKTFVFCLVDVEKNQIFIPPNAWELYVTLDLLDWQEQWPPDGQMVV